MKEKPGPLGRRKLGVNYSNERGLECRKIGKRPRKVGFRNSKRNGRREKKVCEKWSGLSRMPAGHPCGSIPHLKQDSDYFTRGCVAVGRRARVRGKCSAYLGKQRSIRLCGSSITSSPFSDHARPDNTIILQASCPLRGGNWKRHEKFLLNTNKIQVLCTLQLWLSHWKKVIYHLLSRNSCEQGMKRH